ncbi:uncharacterized protein LOC128203477 [Mya arenaria]|uniref:uncharacterized protein LOC128203477 n=1 Tax=Mya arenaria TaxID=6604 RepID=UPI0022E27B69|nr:uncharacterized protein LOC128203477 [Mya arenaria]
MVSVNHEMDNTFSSTAESAGGDVSVHNEIGTTQYKLSDDPRARLMYYIYTVSRILNIEGLDPTLDRFRRFHEFESVKDKTVETLLDVANEFRPRLLVGICIFVNNEVCRKAGYSTLTLPKLPDVSHEFHIDDNYVRLPTFGRIRVTKVLVVKKSWLRYTFAVPFSTLERGMKNFYREEEEEEEEKMQIALEIIQEQEKQRKSRFCNIL